MWGNNFLSFLKAKFHLEWWQLDNKPTNKIMFFFFHFHPVQYFTTSNYRNLFLSVVMAPSCSVASKLW